MSDLRCSVIVPSYNRRATLEMVLEGLARQTLPLGQFEVIVVLDGSTDDSNQMLTTWQRSGRLPHLRSHRQPNSGQATARNTGAQLARSPVLLFLDDDVVPDPDLVATHIRHYAAGQSLAVLGDCLVVRERQDSLYHLGVWSWWEDTYNERALAGRQPGFRDFCAGNVSLRRDDFLTVGGFNPAFRGYGGEDFELGYRLLRHGVRFVPDRRARARHYHRTTVKGVLRATRQEGLGDVLLGQMHPELRSGLRLMTIPSDRYGLLVRMAVLAPAPGDLLMAVLGGLLPLWERLRMRRRWQAYFNHMRGYAYWRGVRDALGSWKALREYQAEAHAQPHYTLDISDGLPTILPPLWVDGPSTIAITFGGKPLGAILIENAIMQPVRRYLADAIVRQLGARLAQVLQDDQARSSSVPSPVDTQAAA